MKYSFVCLLVLACELTPVTPRGVNDVERRCNRLRDLGCPEGDSTPKGATCEEVVHNAAEAGIDLVGGIDCTMASRSCDEARACVSE
jgi:hypothetical protein